MAIYFDIGANNGHTSVNWVNVEDNIVYAFEPNPFFKGDLAERRRTKYYAVAVSNYNGRAVFNVCTALDRGCSSLLAVSPGATERWGGRTDFIPESNTEVEVIRLDSLDWSEIPEVEWFHCDAQGSDLAVLEGLGQYASRIKAGVVEVASKPDILYVGQNTKDATVAWLEANGFEITKADGNDGAGNELNVEFRRK